MRWYYAEGKSKTGPVTEFEIDQLVKQGKITPDTLVWNEVIAKWQPYGELKGDTIVNEPLQDVSSDTLESVTLVDEVVTQVESLCDECGRSFPVDEMVRYGESMVCATCKPLFFQKLKEGVLPHAMRYAGFWIRFAAKMIDGIIVGLINTVFFVIVILVMTLTFVSSGSEQNEPHPLFFILFYSFYFIIFAVNAAYDTYFVGKYAATPGKMACGIKVVTADGDKVSFARAFARHFAELISKLTFTIIIGAIGYIMAAFDSKKRALHDHICNTRVIWK